MVKARAEAPHSKTSVDGTDAARFLFAYGTLMFPEVRRAVLGREAAARPGRVWGFRRHALRGRIYPGVVPAADEVVGEWVGPLTAEDWRRLDDFEDDFYLRERVTGALEEGGEIAGDIYRVGPEGEGLVEPGPWDAESMRSVVLSRFTGGH